MMKNLWVVVALAVGGIGCGTQYSGNYTGTWSGTSNSAPITATTFNMTLYQQGSSVNGYWQASGGSQAPISGQVQGSVNGTNLTANFIIPALSQTNPGAGTFTGNLIMNSQNLSGSITGTSTTSGALTATLNLQQSR